MTATFSPTISLPTPPIKQAKLYINGQWRSASNGKTRPTISPISETAIADIPEAFISVLPKNLGENPEGCYLSL